VGHPVYSVISRWALFDLLYSRAALRLLCPGIAILGCRLFLAFPESRVCMRRNHTHLKTTHKPNTDEGPLMRTSILAPNYSWLRLPRVLEYYSSRAQLEYFFTTRVLATFYFLLQTPFPVAVFFALNWWFFWNSWKMWAFAISVATCPPSNRHVEKCLFKAMALLAPGTLTQHPFFVNGSLY